MHQGTRDMVAKLTSYRVVTVRLSSDMETKGQRDMSERVP